MVANLQIKNDTNNNGTDYGHKQLRITWLCLLTNDNISTSLVL